MSTGNGHLETDIVDVFSDTFGSIDIGSFGVEKTDREDQEIVADIGFGVQDLEQERMVSTGLSSGNQTLAAMGAGRISLLLKQAIPSDRRKATERAYFHVENDDLLCDLINIMVDFTTLGLSLQSTPPLQSGEDVQQQSSNFQTTLNKLRLSMDIDKVVDDLTRDWYVSDNMVLYWRFGSEVSGGLSSDGSTPNDNLFGIPGLQELAVLNPALVDWNNSLGGDILMVKIPDAVRERIKAAFDAGQKKRKSKTEIRNALHEEGIGDKWIDAILNSKRNDGGEMVELKAEDGDYWIIRTKARKNCGLATPSMKTIFLDLEMRGMAKDAEFSVFYMLKHFIMLIKAGESIQQGPLAGQKTNWLNKKESKTLLNYFSVVSRAMRAAVNHTVKIEYIYPPPDMFSVEKFKSCESRMFNWSGVTKVMTSGEGSDYGGGYLSIRKTIAKIEKCRLQINLLFMEFFNHPTIVDAISTPKEFSVTTNFDVNVLKEPRQLLDEVKWLFESGISDQRTSAQELGRDPERLKSSAIQSRSENETDQVWEPIGLQGQSLFGFTGDEGQGDGSNPTGRPIGTGKTRNEHTRTRSPGGRLTENV